MNKSALLNDREFKLAPKELTKVNSFINKRIEHIQKVIGISEDGIISLASVIATDPQCEQSYSLQKEDSPRYEIISVRTKDGRIEGYLWNVYGKRFRSFYQQVKYNEDGSLKDVILWSEDDRIFFSTDRKTVIVKMSNSGEEGEGYEECVARVFQAAQQACEIDPVCNLRCTLLPVVCEGYMIAAAAFACLIYG